MDVEQNKNTVRFFSFTHREWVGLGTLFFVGVLSFEAWLSFSGIMASFDSAPLLGTVLWFVLVTLCFFFGAVVWTNSAYRVLAALFLFLPGMYFFYTWEYGVVGLVAMVCFYLSSLFIANEGQDRMRFHFYQSIRSGSFIFIVGLSLILSGGYYSSVRTATWEALVPRFRIGEGMTKMIFKVAGVVNPSFAELSNGNVSVDEFLLSLEKTSGEANSPTPLMVTPGSARIAQELYLESGREQIATLAGRTVAGNEKISDVLSASVQNKLISMLSGTNETGRIPSQAIPFFLSLLLFLTLLSFASLITPLCIIIAYGFFLGVIAIGWLKLEKVMVEQEKLAL